MCSYIQLRVVPSTSFSASPNSHVIAIDSRIPQFLGPLRQSIKTVHTYYGELPTVANIIREIILTACTLVTRFHTQLTPKPHRYLLKSTLFTMPATRRSTRSSSQAGGKQATLSFHNRVTKAVPKSSKNVVSSPSKQSPPSKHVVSASQEAEEQAGPAKEDIVLDDAAAVESEPEAPSPVAEQEDEAVEKTDAELQAENITGRQVDQYWRKLEGERIAKRVHQEDLSQAEKVLRYFDVSSQYGVSTSRPGKYFAHIPCIVRLY